MDDLLRIAGEEYFWAGFVPGFLLGAWVSAALGGSGARVR